MSGHDFMYVLKSNWMLNKFSFYNRRSDCFLMMTRQNYYLNEVYSRSVVEIKESAVFVEYLSYIFIIYKWIFIFFHYYPCSPCGYFQCSCPCPDDCN